MSAPNYSPTGMGAPLSGAPPILELPRSWSPRVALILLVLLPGLAFFPVAGYLAIGEQEFASATLCTAVGLALLVLAGWRLWAEFTRVARVYDGGIELVTYTGPRTLRWEEVTEITFFAQRIQAGGLLGIAWRALMDKIRSNRNMEERGFMIRVTFAGANAANRIVLTQNDKGVLKAWEEGMARVNPRLLADVLRRVRGGERVVFGKNAITLSTTGLSFGKKPEVPWQQMEKISIVRGAFSAKVTGKWLSSNALIGAIPNLFVLTKAIEAIAGGVVQMDVQPGINLASGVYV
ncbi:MAG TPA: DUF6585 family protein [bacterium]|nr:DUF6585 family protein [bacterium]